MTDTYVDTYIDVYGEDGGGGGGGGVSYAGPRVKVEMGLVAPSASTKPPGFYLGNYLAPQPYNSLLGTPGSWPAGYDPAYTVLFDDLSRGWTDVTSYVLNADSVNVDRGSSRQGGPAFVYDGGRCSFTLDNADGRFDPENTASPYWVGGTRGSNVRPGCPVRISVVIDLETVRQFIGWVDDFRIDYPLSGHWSTVGVTAIDSVERIRAADRPPLEDYAGDGDTAVTRLGRILDRIGWSSSQRDMTGSTYTLQPSYMEDDPWSEMTEVAVSDLGYLWVGPDGDVRYRSRNTLPRLPTMTVGHGTSYPATDLVVRYDKAQVVNATNLKRRSIDGYTTPGSIEVNRTATQSELGIRSYSNQSLWQQDDSQVQNMAEFFIDQWGTLSVEVESVSFKPTPSWTSAAWSALLSVDIGERVSVVRRRPDATTATSDVIVTGVKFSHRWPNDFTVTWTTGLAPQTKGNFVLNVSKLDTGTLQLF